MLDVIDNDFRCYIAKKGLKKIVLSKLTYVYSAHIHHNGDEPTGFAMNIIAFATNCEYI